MNTKDRIFQKLTVLCMIVLLWSCKNDDWYAINLDSTPVYELYSLKDANTNQSVNVSKFSVYRETLDLIAWQNDFQTLRMNKIEFFDESNNQPAELPVWLNIDPNKEQYLTFSFNELFVEKEEIVNSETGVTESKDVEKKRMFIFEGKKDLNSSAGFGHLTVTEEDGTIIVYIAALNDILKPTDQK